MAETSITGDDGAGRQKSMRVDYPGNSHKARPPKQYRQEKNVEKVINGEVVTRNKPMTSKLREAFSGDDTQSVISYIFFDVVIPAAKSMLADATSQFIERLLFGESRRQSGGRQGYTSYNKMYSSNSRPNRPEISQRGRATHNFGEVILSTRGEAEHVLDSLTALIDEYQVATVADLYDLVGITGNFTDDKWGWYDLRGSGISRIREGYLINLPQTQPID
jgi:hypothetical protein